jgi:mediator of RNA polymerase II transcription subunit 17, fungi type
LATALPVEFLCPNVSIPSSAFAAIHGPFLQVSDRIGGDSPTASSNEEEAKVGRFTLLEHAMTSESADWSKTRLSLEKPYKDANGVPLKKLVEISYDEEFVYEPPKSVDEQLGTRLQRVFDERGNAIWNEYDPQWAESTGAIPEVPSSEEEDEEEEEEEQDEEQEVKKKPMNVDELSKLRSKVIPTLMQGSPFGCFICPNLIDRQALNELMLSREVMGVYLRTATPGIPEGISPELLGLPPKALASTTVTKPPPLPSVQAFNSQLTVGGKDEAIRKSAAAFKSASTSMRRALASGERYWKDALRARNANWAILAAPQPFGAMTRRATDNNAIDICISYGLEHGEY